MKKSWSAPTARASSLSEVASNIGVQLLFPCIRQTEMGKGGDTINPDMEAKSAGNFNQAMKKNGV